ncbi:MarR family winged helix-turn-helix transcriptional regulator [Acutalibacter intestini]|uniref:MarR family winged helix-turn-helix transcriptional regulator n=1 Tax=Acutalibacter intestini TaxID=3093659 RepID=UPI002AC9535C|nr:MarR family transcriptional regulator [Acutalibacter sp. M00204]
MESQIGILHKGFPASKLRDISHTMRDLSEGRGSQKRILILLLETGPITQRELTERLGIQPGSASKVVAKLENAGLLTRTESKADRRTVDVTLTGEGENQAKEAKSQRDGRHGEMFAALSEDEKSQLLGLLEKVNRDWESRHKERRCHHHGRHGKHSPHSEQEGSERHHEDRAEERPHCNHDCPNCPNPCGKGRALRESGR